MSCPCRVHAVPMPCPCRAHAVYMQCTRRTHAVHMPCTCHAHAHAMHMHMPCTCTCRAHAHAHAMHMHMPCTCRARAVHVPCTCYPDRRRVVRAAPAPQRAAPSRSTRSRRRTFKGCSKGEVRGHLAVDTSPPYTWGVLEGVEVRHCLEHDSSYSISYSILYTSSAHLRARRR